VPHYVIQLNREGVRIEESGSLTAPPATPLRDVLQKPCREEHCYA